MPKFHIFVDGGAGTTGLRIHERLAGQRDICVLELPEAERKNVEARLEAIRKADLTILCLPDEASAEIAALVGSDAKLCDASTAHRTKPDWVYGLPELQGKRAAIQHAQRVAVPGCHATGFVLLAAPLLQAGIVAKETQLCCHSITGYSGGGKQMIAAYERQDSPVGYASPRQYALGLQHKHLPEMQAASGLVSPPLFSPIVANYYSGMLLSLPLPMELLAEGCRSATQIAKILQEYYAGQPLVRIHAAGEMPPDGTLAANALAGRDNIELFVLGNDDQILLAAQYCNLGKGASGAAVQCMNLMLGRPKTSGLVF